MPALAGQALDALDSPQLLLDLDVMDANLRRMFDACARRDVAVRVHFKSLKCTGLARYVAAAGAQGFVCAKLNEAEALADAGITDLFIANQLVGPLKVRRAADLAKRAHLRVCVDDAQNVEDLARAAQAVGATIEVLVELDLGMNRCGVEPGGAALALARRIHACPGLRFVGLQGYQGHLQMLLSEEERRQKTEEGLDDLMATRDLIEEAGVPVAVVTGGGTGNWDMFSHFDGVTEIQPGSFVLMDCAYHNVRPEFGCALSILCSVISRRPEWYVLDAGSKAISRDFGTPVVKGQPLHRVTKLAEEHTKVECSDPRIRVGDRFEVLPAHCCATMNLHRTCIATRKGRVEAVWPIEASGRYD
jgi:D-serine deaminase-like pyridoxal phosphate-dependent protein